MTHDRRCQVSIVTYGRKMIKDRNVGKITVRGKGWDATLGGGWFNVGLANMLADDFNSKVQYLKQKQKRN